MAQSVYLLENRTQPNSNTAYFWRKGGSGYTANLDEAQRFTAAEADHIISSTQGSHRFIKHPVEQVYNVAIRSVNIEDLRQEMAEQVR